MASSFFHPSFLLDSFAHFGWLCWGVIRLTWTSNISTLQGISPGLSRANEQMSRRKYCDSWIFLREIISEEIWIMSLCHSFLGELFLRGNIFFFKDELSFFGSNSSGIIHINELLFGDYFWEVVVRNCLFCMKDLVLNNHLTRELLLWVIIILRKALWVTYISIYTYHYIDTYFFIELSLDLFFISVDYFRRIALGWMMFFAQYAWIL